MIVGDEDEILISHESFSRKAFAQGAIRSVKFICGKSGYYEMSDVLNLQRILKNLAGKDTGSRKDSAGKHSEEERQESAEILAL